LKLRAFNSQLHSGFGIVGYHDRGQKIGKYCPLPEPIRLKDSQDTTRSEMILLDILSNISPTCMKYAKMRKLFVILLNALLVILLFATSWREETKYTAVLLHGTEFEERNQGEKMRSDAIEVSRNFIS